MSGIRASLPRTYSAFFAFFPRLRPAQELAIPSVLAGRNVLLISPTGSGKTEAVMAPVAERALEAPEEMYCLYICPTRALVNDIERRIEAPLQRLLMRVGVRHGDRKTVRGKAVPNILITTPESLDVMLSSPRAGERARLRTVRTVVVDEVHQFYQTHRGYQLVLLLERLKSVTKRPLQRLLLSATVAQPQRMAQWFQGSDVAYEVLQVPGGRALSLTLDRALAVSGAEYQRAEAVTKIVKSIVGKHHKVLLFANSRNECDWLYWKLHDQLQVETLLHYSTLDKVYREGVERRFQSAHRALCIATSTLELGIDVGDIDAVVMYGAPPSISSFVQRVGRGNRRSGKCVVYGICRDYHIDGSDLGAEEDLLLMYALVACMVESELEARPQTRLFSVLVQQFFSLTYRYGSVIVPLLARIVEVAEPDPFATESGLTQVLHNLANLRFYSYRHDTEEYYPTEKWEGVRRSLQLWGNIATRYYDTVVDKEKDVALSQVPRGQAEPGRVFLMAGQPRMVTGVSGTIVTTQRLSTGQPELIAYETMGAATPPEVTQKACEILCSAVFPELPVEVDDQLKALLRSWRRRFREFDFEHKVPFDRAADRYRLYTFGGTWANELIAMYLRDRGRRVDADSWRVLIDSPIQSLRDLPSSVPELEKLVARHLDVLIRRMSFSCHFYQLPDDLQRQEVCSLLDLPRLAQWFGAIRVKELCEVPA